MDFGLFRQGLQRLDWLSQSLKKNNIFLILVIKEEKDPVHEADVCESPIGKKIKLVVV